MFSQESLISSKFIMMCTKIPVNHNQIIPFTQYPPTSSQSDPTLNSNPNLTVIDVKMAENGNSLTEAVVL
jgi:hypothetical protein